MSAPSAELLVLGLAALSAFSDIAPGLCDMRGFWGHAAACGVYASLLAAACPGTAPERVFVGGLLHDIGQLVIMRKLPAAALRGLTKVAWPAARCWAV